MNINDLFNIIQEKFNNSNLKGEFTLHKNSIIWTYELDEYVSLDYDSFDPEDEEYNYNFHSSSLEELLNEAYSEVIEMISGIFDEIDDDNWNVSEPKIKKDIITIKIS